MPVEYGHTDSHYVESDGATIIQYTKWFELKGYDYAIIYSRQQFCVTATKRDTQDVVWAEPADKVCNALQNAYKTIRALEYSGINRS